MPYSLSQSEFTGKRDGVVASPGKHDHRVASEVEREEPGIPFPNIFAYVPWGHHINILSKSKSVEEAMFYILKTIDGGWSRDTLLNCIKADLYHTQGGAITNFSEQLPSPQSELAQAITKDTYDFGFVSLAEGYKEEALETELESQLTRFLLELGTGFAYLGRQKQIVVAGKTGATAVSRRIKEAHPSIGTAVGKEGRIRQGQGGRQQSIAKGKKFLSSFASKNVLKWWQ